MIQDQVFKCSALKWTNEPIGGDGESVIDMYNRAEKFIQEIIQKHPGETVVVCSHNDTIALMRKAIADYDYDVDRKKNLLDNKTLETMHTIEYVMSDTAQRLDLHKPWVDQIKIKSPETGNILTRITEVLDPWMESASMPYAQVHYPFENKEKFEASFPADYVVEYTGQIRAWFYVMHVI